MNGTEKARAGALAASRACETGEPYHRNRWCDSPDHHAWQHMLLDRAKADLAVAQQEIARLAEALKAAGIELPP